ncbi:ATP-dependent zinc protease family protein [Halocola ammonii]
MSNKPAKKTIGRIDKADFPLLGLRDLDVKIDSGAFTSSLHCHHIVEKDGKLQFSLLDPSHEQYHNKPIESESFRIKKVRSSNGLQEERYVITTEIVLFGKTFEIDLTLTNRGDMNFPVLLGRKLLNKNFIVDTAMTNLSHNEKMKNQE